MQLSELENRFLQLERRFNVSEMANGRIVSEKEPEQPSVWTSWFDLINNVEKTWDGRNWVTGWVRAKVGDFTISGTGALTVSGVGFRPKALIVIASNWAATPRILQSTGYTDGVNMDVQYIWNDASATNYVSQLDTNTTGNLIVHLEAPAGYIRADFDGFTDDGFLLDVSSNTLSGSKYGYVALG